MTGFSFGPEFSEDCLVGVRLGGEEALEVVSVSPGLYTRSIFFFSEITVRREVIVDCSFENKSIFKPDPTSMFNSAKTVLRAFIHRFRHGQIAVVGYQVSPSIRGLAR